ncbi:MAG: TMEM165/GDT1 family protein [Candidatus Thermoplasmatota archaeon]|nr:TMEM165/GDT1 family protein [Candidatus Thermoplasmatota archaeon]MBS3789300.1 TMEM165/GDT1 family protein [Candidatus Thermoplasmatota archaeon]
MIWLFIIAITFSSVFVAELGDKSQLITISLASKYENRSVFLGVFSGIAVITILAVAVGAIVFQLIPLIYVKMIASILFIFFGINTLFFQDEEKIELAERRGGVFTSSFLLSIFAEMGDKTQLLIVALVARYSSPLFVLIGALIGMGTIIAIGVLLGSKIGEFIESKKIDMIAGSIFLILGVIFLLEVLFFG